MEKIARHDVYFSPNIIPMTKPRRMR